MVTAADDYVADVLVEGERIALVGADLDVAADRTIDARGRYVLPGCTASRALVMVAAPALVLLRGSFLVEDGELVAAPGPGRFVRRARFGEPRAVEPIATSS